MLVCTTLSLAVLVERRRHSRDAWDRGLVQLAAIGIVVFTSQLTLGRFDVHARYTLYILALHVAVLAAGFAPSIERIVRRLPWFAWAAVLCLVALRFSYYAERSLRADLAARNIYEQQYQMYRLAADFYRAPVAVNDLGRVSYRNPYPVLDLWGLGSEEARVARAADPTSGWMAALTVRHNVGLAMIYDRWFPSRPADWVPVARLTLGSPRVTAGDDTVTVYATAPEHVAAIAAAIDRLAARLPAHVGLDRVGQQAQGGAQP